MKTNRRQFLSAAGAAVLGSALCVNFPLSAQTPDEIEMTVCQLTNKTRSQMMSYIIRTKTGELIVVDGGMAGDADHLLEMLEKLNGGPNPKVTAWFLSHCHSDHFMALTELIRTDRLPEVEKFYFNFPELKWIETYEAVWAHEAKCFFEHIVKVQDRIVTTQKDQKLTFGPLTVTVLNDPYLCERNPVNNSNVCFRFETKNSSLLFLGDLGKEGSTELLKLQPAEMLRAEAVQMAHHGQQGATRELYAVIAPKICFWPTPDWLWNNDRGKGPDSGPWKIRLEQQWMKELNVQTHYIGKDGTVCVDLD
ncbi:MAG: MBL fold metallo-hydrolase [Planctomycetaceae bacterium]|nr:MBL fold metallo-hydrolase [Planctomycetaceae bacterium]